MDHLYHTDPRGKARWHLDSCQSPDVVINSGNNLLINGPDIVDGVIDAYCRTCKRTPNVSKLIATHRQQNASGLLIPPDEPYGDFRLWWPRTVPYSSGTVSNEVKTTEGSNEPNSAQTAPGNVPGISVYPQRLAATEFRLLCLDPIVDSNVNSPVHMILETHNDERYPEYETVSYTWGGEENDASLCRPIYVGPYWDVLLQTKNCWGMLQYLRLSSQRAHRYLWVDAICIDQSNNMERGLQVAKMGLIYKNSTRTIIWLGNDIVKLPLPGKYPQRGYLDEICMIKKGEGHLGPGGKVNLWPLFQRRYFGRVWIIQELLLSRQLVMPVDDMEILFDSLSTSSLSGWEDTAAQWVQYSARGRHLKLNIMQLMAATVQSQASDPRDKVFGLLGLAKGRILPDYSISHSHTLIGITAHCLFDLFYPEILLHACGNKAGGNHPSWSLDLAQLSAASIGSVIKMDCVDLNDFRNWWGKNIQFSERRRMNNKLTTITTKLPPKKVLGSFPYLSLSHLKHIRPRLTNWDKPRVRDVKPWFRRGTVDTSRAALSINLTHLFTVKQPPRFISEHGNFKSYCFENRDNTFMYTFSRHAVLNELIKPGDQVFILERHQSSSPLCLILRGGWKQDGKVFKLICCCEHVLFEWHDISSVWWERFTSEPEDGKAVIGHDWSTSLSTVELQYSLDDILEDINIWFGVLSSMIYGAGSSGLLDIVEDTVEEAREVIGAMDQPWFLDTCAKHVPARFQPAQRFEDGLLLSARGSDWLFGVNGARSASKPKFLSKICSRWKYIEKQEWMVPGDKGFHAPEADSQINMWIKGDDLKRYLGEKYTPCRLLLQHSFWATSGKAWGEIFASYPKTGKFGRFIACPRWPDEIVGGFGITGNTYQVTIE